MVEIADPAPDQPGWTVARPIMSCCNFHRQLPGSESVGGVALLIEPRQDSRSILFVDNLPDDQAAEAIWIKDIIATVSAVAVKGLGSRNPVVGLTITLTGLDLHPIDSRSWAFRYSTDRAMLEAFKSVGLVEWRSAGGPE